MSIYDLTSAYYRALGRLSCATRALDAIAAGTASPYILRKADLWLEMAISAQAELDAALSAHRTAYEARREAA